MQKLLVELSGPARDDLIELYQYIVEASGLRNTASRFIDRIEDRCQRIGDVPEIGTQRDDLQSGLRLLPFEKRVMIAYRIEDGTVIVGRIFYGGRDYETLLRDGE